MRASRQPLLHPCILLGTSWAHFGPNIAWYESRVCEWYDSVMTDYVCGEADHTAAWYNTIKDLY